MPRIRTIKPEFPQSESMGRISREARLCFILLWTLADDFGRARANSRMLASLLYPYDDDAKDKIDGWLEELETENCIIRYEVDGQRYLEIVNWLSHQKIDHPSQSKFPDPREGSRILAKPRESSINFALDQGSRIKDQGEDQGSRNSAVRETLPAPKTPTAAAAPKAQPLPGGDLQVQTKPRKTTKAKPKADQTKAVALQESTELYTMIKKSFEAVFGDFANYAKEGMAIKGIIKLGKADPVAIRTMIETFYSLTRSNSNFWSTRPFTPNSLLAMWDHVKVAAQKEQEREDVSWFEALSRGEELR